MWHLVLLDTPFAGKRFDLVAGKNAFGRAASNALVLCDRGVSRRHGEILVWRKEVIVRDLGSRNGTLVNGRRLVGQQAPVRAGEVIQFGRVKATVEFEPPDARWRLLEGDTATDITAYYGYLRWQLGLAVPPPAPAPQVLAGDAAASGDDPTVPAPVPPGEERPAVKPGPTVPLKPGRLTAWLGKLKHSVN